jgi:small-conductance mechanosensitive channel
MSFMKRSILLGTMLLMIVATYTGVLWADSINPAQEQEFIDARSALESAKNAQAEKYAISHMKQAEDFLQTARNARQIPDPVGFSRTSLLSRAYAELALALSKLAVDVENLSATQESIQKAKAEIEQLKNRP